MAKKVGLVLRGLKRQDRSSYGDTDNCAKVA
jgi:hypothetical protein